ncbi:MAG: AtpZ/AtpI family protein [Anaerolineae bacterium]|nr:AtpZ/AtpI family protein [Anaerolineae bacterium]
MQPSLVPPAARSQAAQAVIGEIGCSALVIVLLATGAGLLLDFQVTNLHPVFSVALPLLAVPAALYWAVRRTLSMSQNRQSEYVRNLALAAVAGQAGCLSVVLIFMALFAGLFLDARLNTHPVFTIGLVLVSVPLSLYAMIRLMLSSVGAIRHAPPAGTTAGSHSASANTAKKENGS